MTSNVSHLTEDLLSAYVDEELDSSERRALEEHLDACLSCQHRLDGLRRVVGGLRALERAPAPPSLAGSIQRHLALDESQRGLDRYRLKLPAAGRLPTHGFVLFSVIVALAAILFLFAEALERQDSGPAADPADQSRQAWVGGRTFELSGESWIEQGVDPARASWALADSELAERMLNELPGLRSLLDTGGGAVLRWEGQVIGLRAAGAPEEDR